MIIRGLLDRSLSSQLCIRGYAPIKELARISRADYKYQRKTLEKQESIITTFLEIEKYLFFPEVILSYKIKHDITKSRDNALNPLQKIEINKKFKSNVDNTSIKVKPVEYQLINDIRNKSNLLLVELNLDDVQLNDYIAKEEHPFHRIDGNHRLTAAENTVAEKVQRMTVPFCIILGEEFYDNGVIIKNESSTDFDKSLIVYFHNINTKTIPLTSEQNLNVIIDNERDFLEDELKEILGDAGVNTRKLKLKIDSALFTNLKHILFTNHRSIYLDVFTRLIDEGIVKEDLVENVFEALKEIELIYKANPELKANSSIGLLTAFMYYRVTSNNAKFKFFTDWVMSNKMYEVIETEADTFITIFEKIYEQTIKVFVAMPYFKGDPDIIREYNDAYEKVIKNYPHVKIELYPIMEYVGRSVNILQNIIEQINESRIFIADVTLANPNVTYELGYAMSLKKHKILIRKKEDIAKLPFDYYHDLIKHYKDGALTTLQAVVYDDIVGILKKDFGLIAE